MALTCIPDPNLPLSILYTHVNGRSLVVDRRTVVVVGGGNALNHVKGELSGTGKLTGGDLSMGNVRISQNIHSVEHEYIKHLTHD